MFWVGNGKSKLMGNNGQQIFSSIIYIRTFLIWPQMEIFRSLVLFLETDIGLPCKSLLTPKHIVKETVYYN